MSNHSCRVCPVCRESPVTGKHHIKPVSEGGADIPKNKVGLCKRCHDIVEDLHNRTGMEYSFGLARFIRLEFGFPHYMVEATVQGEYVVNQRPKTLRLKETPQPKQQGTELPIRTCARCGDRFQPSKFFHAICQRCDPTLPTCAVSEERARVREKKRYFSKLRKSLLRTNSYHDSIAA